MSDRSSTRTPALQLQPMVHVRDMAASVAFYEHLGGSLIHGDRDGDWVLMQVGNAQIGLVSQPPDRAPGEGPVELNFQSLMPLDEFERQLRDIGVAIAQPATGQPTTGQPFGRQLQLTSPDGMLIKINQLEPDGYA